VFGSLSDKQATDYGKFPTERFKGTENARTLVGESLSFGGSAKSNRASYSSIFPVLIELVFEKYLDIIQPMSSEITTAIHKNKPQLSESSVRAYASTLRNLFKKVEGKFPEGGEVK